MVLLLLLLKMPSVKKQMVLARDTHCLHFLSELGSLRSHQIRSVADHLNILIQSAAADGY